jgi:hypothetical protein
MHLFFPLCSRTSVEIPTYSTVAGQQPAPITECSGADQHTDKYVDKRVDVAYTTGADRPCSMFVQKHGQQQVLVRHQHTVIV